MGRPIEVVGSLNIDLVTNTPRMPAGGETIKATSFTSGFGGKGANQAVAAARMLDDSARDAGSTVAMVGAVGDDDFGKQSIDQLKQEQISPDAVRTIKGQKTGTSVIIVEDNSGENRILFSPGANYDVTPGSVALADDGKHGLVVFQLETPFETIMHVLAKAKNMGKETVLNPAPASVIPDQHLRNVDHLIVNETEASILSGASEMELANSLDRVADTFLSKGVSYVIITLGAKGVYWKLSSDSGRPGKFMQARKVQAVDTTAAGDTFVGAYVAHLSLGPAMPPAETVEAAVEFANQAAAISVQKKGAQASIPFAADVTVAA